MIGKFLFMVPYTKFSFTIRQCKIPGKIKGTERWEFKTGLKFYMSEYIIWKQLVNTRDLQGF